jgi:hypothetical protein
LSRLYDLSHYRRHTFVTLPAPHTPTTAAGASMTVTARYDYATIGLNRDVKNLNDLRVLYNCGDGEPLSTFRDNLSSGDTDVFFTDLAEHLCAEIAQHNAVVGCVAWLTNEAALRALAQKQAVTLLVQKEDFLRPDVGGWSQAKTRRLYDALPAGSCRHWDDASGGRYTDAVYSVGVRADRRVVPPRMHHKFLVFGNTDGECFTPASVWTGSFNITENATRSLENAVLMRRRDIAEAYYKEFRALLLMSEPLDWITPYVEPVWRIVGAGT